MRLDGAVLVHNGLLTDLNKNVFFFSFNTVVDVYNNAMKTTLDLNFDFYKAFKQHGYTYTIHMETKQRYLLTASLCSLVNL